MLLPESFEGTAFRLADEWFDILPLEFLSSRPIQYLEIGTFYGANLISVANSYAKHPESQLHCIDPWEDYDDYSEYKGQQQTIYETFLKNLTNSGLKHKVSVHRGYSHKEIPSFQDEQFDLIYIDGNHEPEYVLEDAVLCFRKLKPNGILIFDDYGWGGPDMTQRGITAFLSGYAKRIHIFGYKKQQVYVQKLH